jgi:CBS-domain-containing membrane protein
MLARDLMTTPVITCHVNDSLAAAAQKMWDFDIGAVAVVNDEGKLTGMLTDRDICMAGYTQARGLEDLLVNVAMASHVFAAMPEQTLADVEQLMANHQVRRIPIVDGEGRPIGIVTMNDLAIESVQPDTPMKHAPSKLAHTLAAICRHRAAPSKAA